MNPAAASSLHRTLLVLGCLLHPSLPLPAAEDLTGFATVQTAITTTIRPSSAAAVGATGYLGLQVAANPSGELTIEGIATNSRAAQAGFAVGDVIVEGEGKSFRDAGAFREWLRAHAPGETITLSIRRAGAASTIAATLDTASHPLKPSEVRGYVGISYAEPDDRGAMVNNVTEKSPAASAGIKKGDLLTKVGDSPMTSPSTLSDVLTEKNPGDELQLTFLRDEEEKQVTLKLGKSTTGTSSIATVLPSIWKRDNAHLTLAD